MEKRRKDLDRLFEIALVLLGILSSAEFQYFLTIGNKEEFVYAFRMFTSPFIILILSWLMKELGKEEMNPKINMLFTEFCWDLWSFTLFLYLVNYQLMQTFRLDLIGILLVLGLAIGFFYLISCMYRKACENMVEYFKSPKWIGIRLLVFVGAYFLIIFINLPLRV